jgi:hypothetical protein
MSLRLTSAYKIEIKTTDTKILKQIIDAINLSARSKIISYQNFCSVNIKYSHNVYASSFVVNIKMDRFYSLSSFLKAVFYIPTQGFAPLVGLSDNEVCLVINLILDANNKNSIVSSIPLEKLIEAD